MKLPEPYKPKNHIRIVTAASLFDGHDAAINIMRRILQASGAEVIHLGHNRAVQEIVDCAIQEDVQAIALTSYQGGHNEFLKYMYDLLHEQGRGHIKIFAGGGGVILPHEIEDLHNYGITRIYSPDDGRSMSLQGMINDLLEKCDFALDDFHDVTADEILNRNINAIARLITIAENQPEKARPVMEELEKTGSEVAKSEIAKSEKRNSEIAKSEIAKSEIAKSEIAKSEIAKSEKRNSEIAKSEKRKGEIAKVTIPVLGITGTGGAGKSSLVDELVRRYLSDFDDKTIAIISVDPTKRKTGGALLGDRIRMNAIFNPRVFMRSLATRQSNLALSRYVKDATIILQAAGFDLVVIESSGIGQSDTEIVDHSDLSMYVMTPEYGAASQLEKIDMLDFADIVVVNKGDKRGSLDAIRDVKKQYQRNHKLFDKEVDEMPVYGTVASQFNDPGVNQLYKALIQAITARTGLESGSRFEGRDEMKDRIFIIPPSRTRYLSEIADTVRSYNKWTTEQAEIAQRLYGISQTIEAIRSTPPKERDKNPGLHSHGCNLMLELDLLFDEQLEKLDTENYSIIKNWADKVKSYTEENYIYKVRGKDIKVKTHSESLSHLKIPKISLPRYEAWGDILKWNLRENVPGEFPYAAGVFPFKRTAEDPTRMFAGEGGPERTNKRFHYLSHGLPFVRLSTAYDSVTLYGFDPDLRPDIYGKIGNSGVSISCLDDAKKLYSGFDLLDPNTSVSMTINGPAPAMVGYFMNAAIDQQCEKYIRENGLVDETEKKIKALYRKKGSKRPQYQGKLPAGNEGLGLMLLGVTGDQVLPSEVYLKIKTETLCQVRGTVQADILKEDQAQNTCIFSIDFALKMMGDIQQYFIDNNVRNFYSVSISGYHIAEAGANPITQLALTLSNGFTYVEYYVARDMDVNNFAPNLSFFFSNGTDPEYSVIGRVARLIWAKAMKYRYKADARSQMLKYHIQTSGRSLHAQEIDFNDIRTTLQALYAIYDNCNSLHTNAYNEAITTPTEESVRRAMAIQMIINHELGLARNQNPLQGAFIIEELTDLVEEAVMMEFERISERGGVLGAMETMYQRSKIQEESLYYENLKNSGKLPVIGVNTFLSRKGSPTNLPGEVIRSTEEEKQYQIGMLKHLHTCWHKESEKAINQLKHAATQNMNIFESLMEATKFCSIGQITHALFEVGGQYRRNM